MLASKHNFKVAMYCARSQDSGASYMDDLIAPDHHGQTRSPWSWWWLSPRPDLLTQGPVRHDNLERVYLMAWLLNSNCGSRRVFHSILQKARKPTTTMAYYKTWKTFLTLCDTTQVSWRQASIQTVIEFLAQGFHLGLSLATFKGQVSALSPDLIQFLQRVGSQTTTTFPGRHFF